MGELEKIYEEYLFDKLDLIFFGVGGITSENNLGKSNIVKRYPSLKLKEKRRFIYPYGCVYNYTNALGKEVFKKDFYDAREFHEGLAAVAEKDEEYKFIDTKGQSNEWRYMAAGDYSEGYAPVKTYKGTWNFIDHDGNLLLKSGFYAQRVWGFHEGYAKIRIDGKYNFVDKNGDLLFETWLDPDEYRYASDKVGDLHCGRILVGGHYFINKERKFVGGYYDEAHDYSDNRAAIKKGPKWYFIDLESVIIDYDGYDEVSDFTGGYAAVKRGKLWNVIDVNGHFIGSWSLIKPSVRKVSANFALINNRLVCRTVNTGEYKVEKDGLGYQCVGPEKTIKLPHTPIKAYGTRYILCLNKGKLVLYDTETNTHEKLGNINTIEYDDNFIFDREKGIVFLMYENQKIDITTYYQKKLAGKDSVKVSPGVKDIEEKWKYLNTEDARKRLAEEREKNARIREEQEEAENVRILETLSIRTEEKARSLAERKADVIRKFRAVCAEMDEIDDELRQLGRASEKSEDRAYIKELLIKVGDHYEFKPIFMEYPERLKNIDFRFVSLRNVKISGIDFTGCNINLNPQEVYQKDLRGCTFAGLHIDPFMDFTGCDIRGCTFSDDTDERTQYMGNASFRAAIYDETTTYNGIPFTVLFSQEKGVALA